MSDTHGAPSPTPASPAPATAAPAAPVAATASTVLGEGAPPVKVEEPKAPEAPKAPEPAKSEAIDLKALKIPEGLKIDDKSMTAFVEALGKVDMKPQDRAQALLDMHHAALKAKEEAPQIGWDAAMVKWKDEIAQDKEIGSGDVSSPLKPEVKAAISRAIDALGGNELRNILNLTGAGSNPIVVRAFAKISKFYAEGGPKGGNPPRDRPKTAAAALYPDNPEG